MSDADLLEQAREQFTLCEEAEADERAEAIDDVRFALLGEQWPQDIQSKRQQDGRPCLTINRMPAFIRQVVNDTRQMKPSIKVKPVDDHADRKTAEVINGLIRNIENTSNADVAYDTAAEAAVVSGIGYFRIGIEYAHDDTFDKDIVIQRIADPQSVYRDPHSTAADSSDWNVAFVTTAMPKKAFEAKYKGAEPVDWADYADLGATWLTEETVTVAEWWTREEVQKPILLLRRATAPGVPVPPGLVPEELVIEAERYEESREIFDMAGMTVAGQRDVLGYKVIHRLITGAEVLETTEWAGRYIPIIPVYGTEIWVDGKRHLRSLIRDAKDAQRMFNYWRTTSTELVALAPRAPWIGPEGTFDADSDKWATANSENHAFLQYSNKGVPPQRQPFTGPPAGALQEAVNAADDLKSIMGLHDASMGARSNETSGLAIRMRQREGDVSTFHFSDNLSRAIRHAGRILIDLIPAVYSGPRIVRIAGPDGKTQNVKVNAPMPQPDGSTRIFDLAAGKYDLVVETGPSYTTKREEAAAQMTELIRAFPQAAPALGDLLAKNLDWPEADEVERRLQAMLPSILKQDAGEAKKQEQKLEQARIELEMQGDRAEMQSRIEQDKIKAYEAETHRMQVMAGAMLPEQVQALVIETVRNLMQSPDILPPGGMPRPQMPMPQPMPQRPGGAPPQMPQQRPQMGGGMSGMPQMPGAQTMPRQQMTPPAAAGPPRQQMPQAQPQPPSGGFSFAQPSPAPRGVTPNV